MADINQSLNDGVCIDDEVFFGPVSDKERKIREHFETAFKTENKITGELPKIDENDISRNDSLYVSFSVDDSKYDSFDDSLNEDIDKKPQGTKHAPLRKNFDKLKPKKHGFYDSLEDVCSLASNIEKCSISCEVENGKQPIIDDSLRNPTAAVTNKSCVSEQVHFDDDSLAIVEFENTFEDSLEEFNVFSSIEVEEINDIEIVAPENQIVSKVGQFPERASRNLFETSVQVIYEKKRETDIADQEESSADKNMYDSLSNSDFKDILKDSLEESEKGFDNLLKHVSEVSKVGQFPERASRNLFETSVQVIYEKKRETDIADQEESSADKNMYDSLSNSDFKDILKDSLEESEKGIDNLLKHVSEASVVNSKKSEQYSVFPSIKVSEIKDAKFMTSEHKISGNPTCSSKSLLDSSVQIICERRKEAAIVDQEPSDDKNVMNDSLSNSDFKDILKDSLEESEKCIVSVQQALNASTTDTEKLEQMCMKHDILDNSVQIVYENFKNFHSEENIDDDITNSEFKHSLENIKNVRRDLSDKEIIKTSFEDDSQLSSIDVTKYATVDNHNAVFIDPKSNKSQKGCGNRLHPVSGLPELTVSATENPNFGKETFTVDSCHLKLLNDLNVDKDLKFELHIEVTVGDKKCKIAAEDIKLMPATNLNSKINESDPLTLVATESESCMIKEEKVDVVDSCRLISCNENKEHDLNDENILFTNSKKNSFSQKYEAVNEANVTQRVKASISQQIDNSDLKFNSYKDVDEKLLQALDLHDISIPFLNDSVIESNDSVIPLNLCSKQQDIKRIQLSLFRNEGKENFPELIHCFKEKDIYSPGKKTHSKINYKETPKSLQKSPSFKEWSKRTPGTKIPVRKVENFITPAAVSNRLAKQVTCALSAEKGKKHPHAQTPHSTEKKTPNKTPHFCKVRNTIFSKVPQIVPSKKYMNVPSPVAQYIRNTPGSVKTPILDPVLHDCMNHMHQQLESPYHLYQTTKGGSAKSAKRKV